VTSASSLEVFLVRLFPGDRDLGWPTFFDAVEMDEAFSVNFPREWLESELGKYDLETVPLSDLLASLRADSPQEFKRFLDLMVSMYFSSDVLAQVLLRQKPGARSDLTIGP